MSRLEKLLRSVVVVGLALLACCSEPSDAPAASKKSAQEASVGSKLSPAGNERAARAPDAARASSSSSAAGGPIADRGLLGRLPKSSLIALRFPDVALLREAWKRSAMARWYQHPAIAMQMQEATSQFGEMLANLERETPGAAQLLTHMSSLRGEIVFAVESFDLARASAPGGGFPLSLVLFYDAGDQAEALKLALEPLLAKAEASGLERDEDGWGFEFQRGPLHLRVTCFDDCFEARLGAPGAKPRPIPAREDSLLASELVRASPDLARENAAPCAEMYWNLAPVWPLVKAFAPPEVSSALTQCGIDSIEGLSFVAGLGERGLDEVLTLHSPGGKDIFSRALTARPLNVELAKWIPAEAQNASLVAFDLATLFKDVRAVLPPQELAQMDAGLDMLRTQQGLDVRADVIENFGPTFAFATLGGIESWSAEKVPDFVVLIEVRDPARARRAIELSGVPLPELPTSPDGLPLASAIDWEGGEEGSPASAAPTWTIVGHCLVIASDASLARKSLQAAQRAGRNANPMAAALGPNTKGLWTVNVCKGSDGAPDTVTYGRRTAAGLVMENRGGAGTICSGGLIGSVGVAASLAIPKLFVARLSANENAAIATLRSMASAQAQLQSSGIMDVDGDGVGEYGYFAELAGAKPVRVNVRGAAAQGAMGTDQLEPPVLSSAFGAVDAMSLVSRSGYLFQVWLPAASVGAATAGIAEDAGGGKSAAPFPDPDNSEVLWCCYAWPLNATQTGNRCFFINQEGDLLQTANVGFRAYSGAANGPSCYAAYSVENDMDSPLGVGGVHANDDNHWEVVE